jgi:hypothetical protein
MLAFATSGHAAALPRIDILYPPGGSLLDRLCQTDFKVPVQQADIAAAVKEREALQAAWDTLGPAYVEAALDEVGLAFPYREMQATLSVCLPASTSIPLVIDVRPYLPTARHRDSSSGFARVLFHELMHSYVSKIYATSALMHKYASEPPTTTRYHLHVLAIEKMTLLKLDRPGELRELDREYRSGPDPAYKRAWEIVNDVEGYEPFIAELRAPARSR